MERKSIKLTPKKETKKAVIPSKGKDMIINEVLNPLLTIVYQYKTTDSYNNLPVPYDGDILDYYKEEFNKIYQALNKNIYIPDDAYYKIFLTIQSLHSFTRKYSCADGLDDFFFQANPNLNYFTFAYSKEAKEILANSKANIDRENAPSKIEYSISDAYHAKNELLNHDLCFDFDEDEFFVRELAYAVRAIFVNILEEEC